MAAKAKKSAKKSSAKKTAKKASKTTVKKAAPVKSAPAAQKQPEKNFFANVLKKIGF